MNMKVLPKALENIRNEYLENNAVVTLLVTKTDVQILSAQRAALLDEPPAPPQ